MKAEEIPAGRKPMKGKWVYKVKYNPDGSVERFKARWVACGYSQVPGVDFTETFCGTLRHESSRIFLALANEADDDLLEIDTVKAFSSADMDGNPLYIVQPTGFEDPNYAACLLLAPLEGTKQAGYQYMITNTATLTKIGFQQSSVEPNFF